MKKICCLVFVILCGLRLSAQSQEMEQLKLDLEKLAQLKLMLSEMKSGYQSLVRGYNSLHDAGLNNLNLHQQYLNDLLKINPAVSADPSIAAVYAGREQMGKSCNDLLSAIRLSGFFSVTEINELNQHCHEILQRADGDIRLLEGILQPGALRMSDAERSSLIAVIQRAMQKRVEKINAVTISYQQNLQRRLQQSRDKARIQQLMIR